MTVIAIGDRDRGYGDRGGPRGPVPSLTDMANLVTSSVSESCDQCAVARRARRPNQTGEPRPRRPRAGERPPEPRRVRPADDEPDITRRLRAQYAEISQLAGGLAHEIRNPLSTLSLNLDLLLEDFQNAETPRDRRVLQRVERLRDEVQRLHAILENFLRFARVQDLKLAPADLNALVDELRDFYEPTLATKGIVIRTHFAPDLPMVRLDADLFKQALLNLILNAEHAMPSGGELILTTRYEPPWVVLDVIDTGLGHDRGGPRADLRRLLLDPPGRERPGTADHPQDRRGPRRNDPGAERARQGVAVHDRAARVRPAGRGQRRLRPRMVRRSRDLSQAVLEFPPRLRSPASTWPMDQQIRVLVVDDDEPHAAAVAESLERVGYDCVVATSGGEGLRLIEEQVFDIIITDLIMEGVGGLEVLAKAKRELPDAEVVILTGHGTIKTAVTAMQAGASTYLTKPLDINELRTVADKASQSQRLQRSNIELQKQLNEKFGFEGVIGNSSAMHAVVAKLRQIAPTSASVLITGESGTGKELVAKALHINSPRKNKPFVPLNCAELSRERAGKRALRPRQGGVHRRRPRSHRPVPVRQRRHVVPGRDRRHADLDPGQALARARERRDRPRRHQRAGQGQRPADLGDQPRSGRRHRRGQVPPGPVSPPQGRQRQASPVARAARRHPALDRALPQGVHRVARARRSRASRRPCARRSWRIRGPATSAS